MTRFAPNTRRTETPQNPPSHARVSWLGWAGLALTALLTGCATTGGMDGATSSVNTPSAEVPVVLANPPAVSPPVRAPDIQAAPLARSAPQARPEPVIDADLWDRIRRGFAMPDLDTPLVAEKERFYLSRPDYLQRMFARGGRYLFHIVEELEKRGMPTELALLPMVESAFNPVAVSSAKAAGLWQFIPSTGRDYNLSQNWWIDNRRDPVKSTQAALDYLQRIYAMQGNDWFLALASYNWGEGAVQRAMRANASRGKPTDYLSLNMPNETRHYVPKLIALKNILMNAQALGVTMPALPNKPYFVTIDKSRSIDLKLAARFAGMTVDEFVALNPAHNRPVISATKNNQIKLPADRVDGFLAAVEAHAAANKPLATWRPYTLKSGETLETLAQRANTTVAELRDANGLKTQGRIVGGTKILAPVSDAPQAQADEQSIEAFEAPRLVEEVRVPPSYHVVGKRETLASIAGRYGVSVASLQAWNSIRQGVRRGMTLTVRPAGTRTVLTTESGNRQVVASHPVLRGVGADAEPAALAPAPTGPQTVVAALKDPARPPMAQPVRVVAQQRQIAQRPALANGVRTADLRRLPSQAGRPVAPASRVAFKPQATPIAKVAFKPQAPMKALPPKAAAPAHRR